jgi:hypothetical protein
MRWHGIKMLVLAIILAAGLLAVPFGGAQVARADDTPNIKVNEIPDIVSRGERLEYKFTVENWTEMDILRTEIRLPYNTDILTPVDSQLNDEDDWISQASEGQVTVVFGEIEDDESRSIIVEFTINPNTPDSTELKVQAEYDWYSINRSGSGETGDLEVIILNPNAQPSATITPQAGPPGTVYQITANRFWPSETVVTWLNTPNGVKDLDLYAEADNPGRVELTFDSSGLAPGDYSMVLHGTESDHERVVPFTVRPE